MPEIRVAGKRGRLPVKAAEDRFPLRFLHEYTGPLPAPAYPIDVTGGWTDWGMAGNGPDPTCTTHPDGVGDCTFAGRQHNRMAKAAAFGETETWETSNALVAEYLAYSNGQDNGANVADLLLTWYRAGKILAFAPVNHRDTAAMDSAMRAFHGLYCGVQLTDDANERFSEGLPWTVADGQQPDPYEGHCIIKVKADGHSRDAWVTWGALQESTRAWSAACVEEAWVIITSEDEVSPQALAAMRADIDALHGHDLPSPPPALSASLSPPPTPPDVHTATLTVSPTAGLGPAIVRTAIPAAVGYILAWLATRGVHLDAGTHALATLVLTAVITAGYYAAVRVVEAKWPAAGVLLGWKRPAPKPIVMFPPADPPAPVKM